MILIPGFSPRPSCRTIWLSSAAREAWERPLADAARACEAIELEAVRSGQRACATLTTDPEGLIDFASRNPDLRLLPLRKTARFLGFSHRHEDPKPCEPYFMYSVIARDTADLLRFKAAFAAGDNVAQGSLLGFPECCGKFFEQIWPLGYFDPIWQAAEADHDKGRAKAAMIHLYVPEGPNPGRIITLDAAHPYANPLLRYIGIRVSFHIPCSFSCAETAATGERRISLLVPEQRAVVEALLSMPMEWDVLHGIAVIKTPIFWIVTSSVPTTSRYRVRVKGTWTPREAAWRLPEAEG